MQLPESFREKMQKLMGPEWEELNRAWDAPLHQGLRINTLKIAVEEFLAKSPFALEPIPWTRDGFYYSPSERPAKWAYYQAGLYYLQEPSAMAPAACLGVQPGERVLDLCAAPGGKSTQLAAALQGQGILVSNDNSAERVRALIWNLEHWGAANCVVTNETPDRLARVFATFFDKILVDAPCSGEGMFRKNERAAKSWSNYNSLKCSGMQKDILDQAAIMLKPGGRMLYSTCTFAPEENEEVVADFLGRHPEFELLPLPFYEGWEPGRPYWLAEDRGFPLENTRRLWPHRVRGEGHFLALLGKKGPGETEPQNAGKAQTAGTHPAWERFVEENLTRTLDGPIVQQGHYLYRVPAELPALKGLKVPRPGWFLGLLKNNRFEPSQALAMGLKPADVHRTITFPEGDPLIEKYLKGETLLVDGPKGWTLVCLEQYPLGWAKQTGDNLKNYYPAGWRLGNWG